jgi:hemoglobin
MDKDLTAPNLFFRPPHSTIYELVGGMETFRKLAEAFYARIEVDLLLRPIFPKYLHNAIDRQALFLAQYFGGPEEYNAKRGHPRLGMRHTPFKIGLAERDAWLRNMFEAMEEVGIEEPARTTMRQYFEQTANFLMNQTEIET